MFLCQSQSLSSVTEILSSWRWYYGEAFKQYSGLQEAAEASQDEQWQCCPRDSALWTMLKVHCKVLPRWGYCIYASAEW